MQESQEGLGAAERELDAVVVGRLGVRGAWFSPRSVAGRWATLSYRRLLAAERLMRVAMSLRGDPRTPEFLLLPPGFCFPALERLDHGRRLARRLLP